MTRKLLEQEGFDVDEALDGAEARTFYFRDHTQFSLRNNTRLICSGHPKPAFSLPTDSDRHLTTLSSFNFHLFFHLSCSLPPLSLNLSVYPRPWPLYLFESLPSSLSSSISLLLFFCFFSRARSLSLVHSLSLSHHTSSCHRRCLWQRVKPILQSCLTVICRCDLALFCIGRIY